MRSLVSCAALLLAVLLSPVVVADGSPLSFEDPVTVGAPDLACTPITPTDGVECVLSTGLFQDVGARCTPRPTGTGVFCEPTGSNCYSYVWGLHTANVVVGGYSSCNAGAWADV